ncbi:MAG: ParB/RepB/Spo0J family partition protein [Cyanothece sp. SIO1E1]|nr:ParB/RepB/Spo0J family partition protein [Cyanothece sp. SIO1E1]
MSGVAAILGKDEPNGKPPSGSSISMEDIQLPLQQPRRFFDPAKMQELIQSVKEHGILEPLLVRPLQDGKYELVAGERRYRAAKDIGLTQVPIVVRELDSEQALQLALVENLQREDLNPVEETEGILQLLALQLSITVKEAASLLYRMQNEAKGKVTRNVTGKDKTGVVESVFDGLGIEWQSFVRNRLPLLKLPEEILDILRQGKIEYTKAKVIAQIENIGKRKKLLNEAIAEGLPLTEIKARVKSEKEASSTETAAENAQKQVKSLAKSLSQIPKLPLANLEREDLEQLRQAISLTLSSVESVLANFDGDAEDFYQ